MRRVSAIVAGVLSLLLVGLVRTATPPYTPSEYDVLPDESGVGTHPDYVVEQRGFWLADELTHTDAYGEVSRLVTDYVFVVMRARVTPFNRTLLSTTELVTPDGYTYAAIAPYPFPTLTVAHVGQTTTVNYLFEVPEDKLDGAFVSFHGQRRDGIQPMWPRLRFDVVEPTVVGSFEVPPNTVVPRR